MSEINENTKENQASNKSESKKVDEINLIDFNEPEINNVEKENIQGKNSDKDCNVLSEIGKLTAVS